MSTNGQTTVPKSSERDIQKSLDNCAVNTFLANCVWVFHILIVLFMLLTPLTNVPYFLLLHATFSISLLVHWWGNSNVCSLSVIESKLRGLDYTQSFTHQFIAPVYDMSKTTWSNICYVVTILLLCVSVYKMYQSSRWRDLRECISKVSSNNDKTVFGKTLAYINCLNILFTA